jgi:hypothetical protein
MKAEQIFLDALGREPTAEELKEIRLNVWMLAHAGFAVEDASNAPFIAPWAWMWARDVRTGHGNSSPAAQSSAAIQAIEPRIVAVESAHEALLAKFDPGALAARIAKAMPPLALEHRIDLGFQTALRESCSLLWVWIAAVLVGFSGYVGWTLGARHELGALNATIAQDRQQLAQDRQVIDRLSTLPAKR